MLQPHDTSQYGIHIALLVQEAVAGLERQAGDQQAATRREAAALRTEADRLAGALEQEQAQANTLRAQLASSIAAAEDERAGAAHARAALQLVRGVRVCSLWVV